MELSPRLIACRLACLCFAAIQSSVISITNTLFDIASSPQCAEYLASMREEVLAEVPTSSTTPPDKPSIPTAPSQRPTPKSLPPWGQAALARMPHVDSALRESMRLNGFVARGIMKMVTAREGVTLPDGSHIPYGTKVGIQAYSIHRDDEYYPDAETYNAFRFVEKTTNRSRSPCSATGSDSESSTDLGRLQKRPAAKESRALVTTSPTYMAFSHGPNAW